MDPVGEDNSDVRKALLFKSAIVILFMVCVILLETKYSKASDSGILPVIFIAADIIIGIFIAVRMSSWWRNRK